MSPAEAFDQVHDTQAVYRQLLDCMARPCSIGDIAGPAARIAALPGLGGGLAAIAVTLLDVEVRFAVAGTGGAAMAAQLQALTFSRPCPPTEADFVFASGEDAPAATSAARRGTLEQPHTGATVLIGVEAIGGAGRELRLAGPGIRASSRVSVRGLPAEFVAARAEAVAEYPLGVDVVLATPSGRLLALPRSIQVEMGG
jgi:alpha-D-ribose 1-methylphosphonate 5-triphosphate synthase subunit PhnH